MKIRFPRLGRRAFSLLEILCALAIVAMLAALLLPAGQKARAFADNAGCVANLRQMGLAIQNYCNDHDNTLPGPVLSAVVSTYSTPDLYLTGFLAEYLGGQRSSAAPQVLPLALCPAYKRAVPASTWPAGFAYYSVYCLMKDSKNPLYDSSGQLLSPWGRRQPIPATVKINLAPMKLSALSSCCDLSKTWAIQDADGVNYGSGAAYGSGVAVKPVHGRHWNQLYFDFHVEAVPVTP